MSAEIPSETPVSPMWQITGSNISKDYMTSRNVKSLRRELLWKGKRGKSSYYCDTEG